MNNNQRCFGNNSALYSKYHDEEWGIPKFDDRELFELLCLEGAQAGLNWETILQKREGYREAFHNFEPYKCSKLTDTYLTKLLTFDGIIKNKLKIFSVRINALIFLEIQKEYTSFAEYLWRYVDYKPIINNFSTKEEIPTKTALSEKISKDLKKRGMSFVGPTIIYAYMQATGITWDHLTTCPKYSNHKQYQS